MGGSRLKTYQVCPNKAGAPSGLHDKCTVQSVHVYMRKCPTPVNKHISMVKPH